jgi:hypothetical protein
LHFFCISNEAATPSPSRFSPNQKSYIWFSCFPHWRPGGAIKFDRLVAKWMRSHQPPPNKNGNFLYKIWSHCNFPRPSEPTPWHTLVYCHIFEGNRGR